MSGQRKPAFAVFLGLVLAVAAACGSSSATPTSPVVTLPPSASNSAEATTAPETPTAATTAGTGDAGSLINQALSGSADVKSFHIELTVAGTIKAAALAAESGSAAASDVKLDGTSIKGDVDLANGAGHLAISVPAIAAMDLPQAVTADLIVTNNVLYASAGALTQNKYIELPLSSLGDLSQALPVPSLPVPTAGASSPVGDVTNELANLQQQLQQAGATATVVGTEQIGGQDATHIQVTVPVDYINQQIAAQEAQATETPPPALAGAKLDSSTLDVWVYTSNNQLAQIHFTAASSAVGNVDVMLTLTNYDQPVTVTAPPASSISSENPLAGLGS